MKDYTLYEKLQLTEIKPIDANLKVLLLNGKNIAYYIWIRKIPLVLIFVFIKNIFINYSIDTKVFIIKNAQNVIHYTVIQFRKNQYKNIFNTPALEIGPTYTQFDFRNKGLNTLIINLIIKNYSEKNLFAIVRANNEESNFVFNKFKNEQRKLTKKRIIFSFYKITG